jgi:hypothetical protein
LINPNWELEFHVHTNASQLVIGAILAQNLTSKFDKPIMYASRLLNLIKKNYTTIEREALVMVYALHKIKHYLVGNWFVFYVNHMALVYLVNKPQVFGKIARWLLLFLEYDFKIVYKPSRSHLMVDALSKLPNQAKSVYLIRSLMLTCSLYNQSGYKVCMTTY